MNFAGSFGSASGVASESKRVSVQGDHDGMVAREFASLGKLLQGVGIHFLFAKSRAEPNVGEPIGRVLLHRAARLGNRRVVIARVVIDLRADRSEEHTSELQS